MELIQEAAKIKGAQMAKMRVKYETWARFYQNSMFHKEEVTKLRTEAFEERIKSVEAMKNEGNELFKQEKYQDASIKYEHCLSVFKWCHNKNEKWRNEGLRDEDITHESNLGDTEEEKQKCIQLMSQCYSNIAACYTKTQEFDQAVKACDWCLKQDPHNSKVLWRRAQARLIPPTSGAYEIDLALKDLEAACEAAPNDAFLKSELRKLRLDVKAQRQKDKSTYGGMFKRGTVYDDVPDAELSDELTAEEEEIKKALLPMAGGNKKINLNNRKRLRLMQEEAEKNGIDLKDPLVQRELARLARQKEYEEKGEKPPPEEEADDNFDYEAYARRLEQLEEEKYKGMVLGSLRRRWATASPQVKTGVLVLVVALAFQSGGFGVLWLLRQLFLGGAAPGGGGGGGGGGMGGSDFGGMLDDEDY